MDELKSSSDWMTLAAAADHLGVHTTTLRRWADQGLIPVMLTPGGHRRFARADVERIAQSRLGRKPVAGVEHLWVEKALVTTRAGLDSRRDDRWLLNASQADREQKRAIGRRLMGVLMQYIALGDDDLDNGVVLQEAIGIGQQYGNLALEEGISLTDALQATMFFRDSLVEAAIQLPQSARIRPEANMKLLKRINHILNHVQLAIAGAYENDDAV